MKFEYGVELGLGFTRSARLEWHRTQCLLNLGKVWGFQRGRSLFRLFGWRGLARRNQGGEKGVYGGPSRLALRVAVGPQENPTKVADHRPTHHEATIRVVPEHPHEGCHIRKVFGYDMHRGGGEELRVVVLDALHLIPGPNFTLGHGVFQDSLDMPELGLFDLLADFALSLHHDSLTLWKAALPFFLLIL
jgi:hypothetical protein